MVGPGTHVGVIITAVIVIVNKRLESRVQPCYGGPAQREAWASSQKREPRASEACACRATSSLLGSLGRVHGNCQSCREDGR